MVVIRAVGKRGGGMGKDVQELIKQSGYTVNARILGGFQSIRWKISDVVTDTGQIQTYHVQGINHYGIDMGTSRLVGNLRHLVYDVWSEAKFRDPFNHASGVE